MKRLFPVLLLSITLFCSCGDKDEFEEIILDGSWTVEFEYPDLLDPNITVNDRILYVMGIASSAKAVSDNGKLLAEAKLLGLAGENNRFEGVNVEEVHYNSKGKVIFRCKSVFNFPQGVKVGESEKKGIKYKELFTIWPVRKSP